MNTYQEQVTQPMIHSALRGIGEDTTLFPWRAKEPDMFGGKTHLATSRHCLYGDEPGHKVVAVVTVQLFTYEEIIK